MRTVEQYLSDWDALAKERNLEKNAAMTGRIFIGTALSAQEAQHREKLEAIEQHDDALKEAARQCQFERDNARKGEALFLEEWRRERNMSDQLVMRLTLMGMFALFAVPVAFFLGLIAAVS